MNLNMNLNKLILVKAFVYWIQHWFEERRFILTEIWTDIERIDIKYDDYYSSKF